MKIFRSELLQGLDHRLFEIDADSLQIEDLVFHSPSLNCTVTSTDQPDGYKVALELAVSLRLICDRCLEAFVLDRSLNIELRLTDNELLANSNESDIIYFPDTLLEIDLSPVLRDYIVLALPLKKLCRESCQGLCPNCGINRNRDSCSCHLERPSSLFEELSKLNLDDAE
ncbi:MAG: DUF177 domain-containing protein [Fidelibacterota bacterium]